MRTKRIWHKESCTDAPCTCGAAAGYVASLEEDVDMAEGSERHLSAMLKDAVVARDHFRDALERIRDGWIYAGDGEPGGHGPMCEYCGNEPGACEANCPRYIATGVLAAYPFDDDDDDAAPPSEGSGVKRG